MKCPKCRGETRVYDKRWFPIMNTKSGYDMRRRECKRCGYRFLTEFGSIGDKKKAQEVCRLMNRDLPKKGGKK